MQRSYLGVLVIALCAAPMAHASARPQQQTQTPAADTQTEAKPATPAEQSSPLYRVTVVARTTRRSIIVTPRARRPWISRARC